MALSGQLDAGIVHPQSNSSPRIRAECARCVHAGGRTTQLCTGTPAGGSRRVAEIHAGPLRRGPVAPLPAAHRFSGLIPPGPQLLIIAHIDTGSRSSRSLLERHGAVSPVRWRPFWTTWSSSGSVASPSRRVRSARLRAATAGTTAEPDRTLRATSTSLRGVARLAACEGAILVVDASQAVQPRPSANVYLALEPPNPRHRPRITRWTCRARTRRSAHQIEASSARCLARHPDGAKEGSAPRRARGDRADAPAAARRAGKADHRLIFDSWFDPTMARRAGARVRRHPAEGAAHPHDATGKEFLVTASGVSPARGGGRGAGAGRGRDPHGGPRVLDTKIGDTSRMPAARRPPGLPARQVRMVFSGLYPAESAQYDASGTGREAPVERRVLHLRAETSLALARLPLRFPRLLHMEIVQSVSSASCPLLSPRATVAYRVGQAGGERW